MKGVPTTVLDRLRSLAQASSAVHYSDSQNVLKRARNSVCDPTLDDEGYQLVVDWSESLSNDPTVDPVWSRAILGAAQFRLGEHGDSRTYLMRAYNAILTDASEEEIVSATTFIFSFLSMAEHKLGRTSQSKVYLQHVKSILQGDLDKVAEASRLKQLVKEAAQMIENNADPE